MHSTEGLHCSQSVRRLQDMGSGVCSRSSLRVLHCMLEVRVLLTIKLFSAGRRSSGRERSSSRSVLRCATSVKSAACPTSDRAGNTDIEVTDTDPVHRRESGTTDAAEIVTHIGMMTAGLHAGTTVTKGKPASSSHFPELEPANKLMLPCRHGSQSSHHDNSDRWQLDSSSNTLRGALVQRLLWPPL